MGIYSHARTFMKETGNSSQWVNGYPSEELITTDIEKGHLYVCIAPENELAGVFCFREGPDKTYATIYNGQWLNDKPYKVIHRMASNGKYKGIADFCLQWCTGQCNNIRVDTHRDNKVMQHILIKNGYTPCGIIYVENGTERIAFHKG